MRKSKCKKNALVGGICIGAGIGMLFILIIPWGNYIIASALIIFGIIYLLCNC